MMDSTIQDRKNPPLIDFKKLFEELSLKWKIEKVELRWRIESNISLISSNRRPTLINSFPTEMKKVENVRATEFSLT